MSIQGFLKPRTRILDVLLVSGNQLRRQHDIGMSAALQLVLNVSLDGIRNAHSVGIQQTKRDGSVETFKG